MPQSLWLVFGLMLILVVGSILYSFLLSVVFVLVRLCIKSHFLYLSIVTNLFYSLLKAFQCWSSLYLINFLSLFFMICLCFLGLHHTRVVCVYSFLFLLWLGQFSQGLAHFIVKFIGHHIGCCAFQNGYIVEFTFELSNCLISEFLHGPLFWFWLMICV